MKENRGKKYSFTGLGLIFGTALGSICSLIITGNISWWIGIGTGAGLIIGAGVDSYSANKNKRKSSD